MAADIDELVDELEAEFGDSANALLTAAEYQVHLQRAIAEIGELRGQELVEALDADGTTRELDVTDFAAVPLRIEAVEYPVDETPRRFVQWSWWGATLELLIDELPAAGDDVKVYYVAAHVVDGGGSTLPAALDRVALLGGAGYAAQQLQLESTNKANTAGLQAVRDWAAFSATKLDEFRGELRALGAVVRRSRLYTPADPEPNQSTVTWEP